MIKDQKDLRALLTLCRSKGVSEITLGDVSIKFGEVPQKPGKNDSDDEVSDDPNIDPQTGLPMEDLMFLSARQGLEQ